MRARILTPTAENLAAAAKALRTGGLVGMPTETVYGLAGNALDAEALARVFETKERPTFDPLIVHVAQAMKGLSHLEEAELVNGASLSPTARTRIDALINAFWPGPLTLVLPKHERVPDLATSGLPSVGLRMPAHPVAQALISAAGVPLAAPSANRFGRISPTRAQAVADELGDRIDLILDGGPCEVGVESTVVAVHADGALTLLRPGGVESSALERVIGAPVAKAATGAALTPEAQRAPGMLESHYAPVKPLRLLPAPLRTLSAFPVQPGPGALGVLLFTGDAPATAERLSRELDRPVVVRALCPSGDPREAARNLFALMRELDASPATALFAEPCPFNDGLGPAIADRLRRASSQSEKG